MDDHQLIVNHQPIFGYASQPYRKIGIEQFHYQSPMQRPLGRLMKKKAYKHFHFISVVDDNHILVLAYLTTWQVTTCFVYHYDIQTKQKTITQVEDLLGLHSAIVGEPIAKQNYNDQQHRFEFNHLQPQHRVRVNTPEIQVDLSYELQPAGHEPLAVCTPVGINGFSYTHKIAGLPVQGAFSIQGRHYSISPQALLSFDWTAGMLRPETFWLWANATGRCGDDVLAFNLASGVNETGYSENCYWLNGKRYHLNFSRFNYGHYDEIEQHQPWDISADHVLELEFKPYDGLFNKQSKGIIVVDFKQLFGEFNGYLMHEGRRIIIKNMVGFAEYQYLKW